jgi:hypothetical protein
VMTLKSHVSLITWTSTADGIQSISTNVLLTLNFIGIQIDVPFFPLNA